MKLLAGLPFAAMAGCATNPVGARPAAAAAEQTPFRFKETGKTSFGTWRVDVTCTPSRWRPGVSMDLLVSLLLSPGMLPTLRQAVVDPEAMPLLVTSERCFDAAGILRLPSDERMSTLLTPCGLAIEGGSTGAVSRATGAYRNPVDELAGLPHASLRHDVSGAHAVFHLRFALPADMPPGIYRLRCDFGVQPENGASAYARLGFRWQSRDGNTRPAPFAAGPGNRQGHQGQRGRCVTQKPRVYAVLLARYNSNGSRGVVAREDENHFALSNRNIIPDETVLPLLNPQGKPAAYSLEPQFRGRFHRPPPQHPLGLRVGRALRQVTEPSGSMIDLGSAPSKA